MTITELRRQSPIDIRTDQVCVDPDHCQVESLSIDYRLGDCLDVTCSESGWKVNVVKDCNSKLTGSHLKDTYLLAQFHAHWSNDGSCGSEHLLDGKPQSGEVHFVFWNTKYGNINAAFEKEDGLAVVGVLLKEGTHNENYTPLLESIHKACEIDKTVSLPHDMTIDQLLPVAEERDFVTYLGSLTTAPFTESVIWTLFTHPVEVSKEQLNICRKICSKNYRSCQNICDRKVIASRVLKCV